MCKVWWHLDCVGMKRMPRGVWHCGRCKVRFDKAEKKKEQEIKRKSRGMYRLLIFFMNLFNKLKLCLRICWEVIFGNLRSKISGRIIFVA